MKPTVSFRPREMRLALAAGGLIVCWTLIAFVLQPQWDRAHDLQSQVQTQREKLDALSRLFAKAATIEQTYQATAVYLQTTDDDNARRAFLNDLEALSRQANIQLNLKPRAGKPEEHLSRFEVELDVEGAQQNLLEFLDALFRLPKLLTIDRLRISTIPTKEDLLRANLIIQLVTPKK